MALSFNSYNFYSSSISAMVAVAVAPSRAVEVTQPPRKDETLGVDHLMEGKRFLLVGDFPSAADSLAQACHFLASRHGDTANECADAYFHYGKTLLELGRMEAGVLGNALEGVDDGEDESSEKIESIEKLNEDEKEEVGVKVMEALEENFETHQEKINQLVSGHTKLDCDDEDEEDNDEKEEMEDEAPRGDEMETDKPDENPEEEDPSNLERAWEMLELAKNIYSRIKKHCDTLLALGELSIENENYAQAVEDLTSCLEKRKDKLPNDMREIAQTQYQLGVALGYHGQHDEAVKYFNDAVNSLNTMLGKLKADTFNARVGEIDELEKLLPEIQEKIQDTIDSKEESAKRIKGDDGSSCFSSSSVKPVSSIETKKK